MNVVPANMALFGSVASVYEGGSSHSGCGDENDDAIFSSTFFLGLFFFLPLYYISRPSYAPALAIYGAFYTNQYK